MSEMAIRVDSLLKLRDAEESRALESRDVRRVCLRERQTRVESSGQAKHTLGPSPKKGFKIPSVVHSIGMLVQFPRPKAPVIPSNMWRVVPQLLHCSTFVLDNRFWAPPNIEISSQKLFWNHFSGDAMLTWDTNVISGDLT